MPFQVQSAYKHGNLLAACALVRGWPHGPDHVYACLMNLSSKSACIHVQGTTRGWAEGKGGNLNILRSDGKRPSPSPLHVHHPTGNPLCVPLPLPIGCRFPNARLRHACCFLLELPETWHAAGITIRQFFDLWMLFGCCKLSGLSPVCMDNVQPLPFPSTEACDSSVQPCIRHTTNSKLPVADRHGSCCLQVVGQCST